MYLFYCFEGICLLIFWIIVILVGIMEATHKFQKTIRNRRNVSARQTAWGMAVGVMILFGSVLPIGIYVGLIFLVMRLWPF